jgi:hypothetical protein
MPPKQGRAKRDILIFPVSRRLEEAVVTTCFVMGTYRPERPVGISG